MSQLQNLGPGAKKIELERRLDANQDKVERSTRGAGESSVRRDGKGEDPNEAVRKALDKGRY